MNISVWSIRYPVPVILFFLVLTFAGFQDFNKLGIDANPNVDFPLVVVTVAQPGASPVELETDVTKKVEDSLVSISNISNITSTVSDGASSTVVEFKLGTDINQSLNDVRDAIAKIRQDLPQDITEPSITHPNFSGEPIITYSVSSQTLDIPQLTKVVDDVIGRELLTVAGVSLVRRSGGLDREIKVELDSSRLRALGLTADQVSQHVKGLNINMPGGKSDAGGQEQTIRTLGSARDVQQLQNLQIPLPSGLSTRLDSLGTVTDTTAEPRQMAMVDGTPVVSFSIIRAQGSSIVSTEKKVRTKIAELQKRLAKDVTFTLIRSEAPFIYESYLASIDALVLGSVLAIVVIFIFLRNWQATLIGALAIPLSVLGTFIVMGYLNYSLNFLTLLALILVVGILVDDAIVDLENIHRHIAMGKAPFKAAADATEEIGLAVVATTLTIVAVFIPVAFMGGIPGLFFKAFGVTVAVAVLFSLVVARTLTPMMAAYLLPAHAEAEVDKVGPIRRFYKQILIWAIHHRWITMVMAVLIFVGSLSLVSFLPKTFFDEGDISEASISVTLPTGATLADTQVKVEQLRQILMRRPEVRKTFATIGSAVQVGLASAGGGVNSGTVYVLLVPPDKRQVSLAKFEQEVTPLLSEIPGARVAFNHFGPGGGSKPVNIVLSSNDAGPLLQASEKLLSEMRALPALRDVTSSAAELRPEIVVRPDFERAAEQGISVMTIGRIARIATQGDIDVNMPKFNTGERLINIRVQLNEYSRTHLDEIENLLIPGKKGLVPLKSIAQVEMGSGPVQINRRDRLRYVTISGNLNDTPLGQAMDKIKALPALKKLPAGVIQDTLGEAEVMADVFSEFAKALVSAVFFIYAVLVLLFGGFLHPLTIMVALPLSIGGAIVALLAWGKPLGLMSLIGIVMLMGIVTKNSILLVEYTIMAQKKGVKRDEAIIEAGLARLRPIMMTTIAMIAGMLPIAMSWGVGTETKSPMAVAVIGGLITSTLFTLVVVPSVYTIVDDLKTFVGRFIHFRQFHEGDFEAAAEVHLALPAETEALSAEPVEEKEPIL
ncbi:MAG: efflux RND transporter permease subunit [Candidatus Sericytochromatia bacterium]|nr:efflux RND transporter permease subunit [Candidatus Sericytochromatia bacterium]